MVKKSNFFIEKLRIVVRSVTVEPMIFLFEAGIAIANLAMQNLSIEKACRVNLRYSDAVCTAIEKHENNSPYLIEEKEEVQKLVAFMSIWMAVVTGTIPAVLILFFGGWSDRRKRRKPFMLLPIAGALFMMLGLLVNKVFFYQLRMEIIGITESLSLALTGSVVTFTMAVFSYIADHTDLKYRTIRIGILFLTAKISGILGTMLSGVLFERFGFNSVFIISSVLLALAFLIGYFFVVEEPSTKILDEHDVNFFNIHEILLNLKSVLKNDENNRRIRILLMVSTAVLLVGPASGKIFYIHPIFFLILRGSSGVTSMFLRFFF